MARSYGSWYNDKAIDTIDAKLALEGAGAGAKAFSRLAKIPLDIADNKIEDEKIKMAKKKLSIASDSNLVKKYVADQRVKGTQIAANGRVAAASLGLKGHEAAAYARRYDADMGRLNNIKTNNTYIAVEKSKSKTAAAERENKKDVQRLKNKGKAKSPTEKITYGGDDSVTTRVVTKPYKESALDKMTVEDLAKEAKKIRKTHGRR